MALPSSERAPRYRVGDVIAGKYRLDGLLGEGGMGAVWEAVNLTLEAPVAIKVLLRNDGDQALLTQRLKQEAKAAAKLGHPAIVRVFDVGESEAGDPFIVMELLKGRSLAAILAEEVFLSGQRAVRLLLPIADALAAAHAKGIVHRDLKPDNVFIVSDDEQIQPKLVDFGIVKLTDTNTQRTHLTQIGAVLGSPEYMSPEQARGLEDIDHRSDLWSFCVLLYEVISGVTPFAAANYNALLRSIVEDAPRAIEPRSPEEAELWEIILLGLAKDREQRFRSMTELGRALAAWLVRQGVTDDACGASLETKWILRSSDPSALRASRASLPSFGSLPPASGLRPSGELANAPTVEAKATPAQPIVVVPVAVAAATRRFEAKPLLVALASALVAAVLVMLALRSREAASASAATNLTPAPVASAAAFAPTPSPTRKAEVAVDVTVASEAASSSPPRAVSPRPAPRSASARVRAAESKAQPSPQNDLLSPY
jgi:serine/threonine-protein kinase